MSLRDLSLSPSRRTVLAGLGAAAGLGALGRPAPAVAGELIWLGWQGYEECLKAGNFLADEGVDLSTTFINANEDVLAKMQAGGASQVDFVTIYFGQIKILAEAGYLAPLDEAKIPSLKDVVPEFLTDALRHDGKLYAVPFTWGSLQMVYDPAVFPTAPTSWKDGLAPANKGKLLMVNDPVGLVEIWAPIVTGNPAATRLTHAQLKQTIDFLIDMKLNHARAMATSFGEGADMFARNEVVISAIGWEAMVGFAAAKDKKVALALPVEGTAMFMDVLCIPAQAPNGALAERAVETCLQPPGQLRLAKMLDQAIVNQRAIPDLSEANRSLYRYGDLATFTKSARLYPFFPLEKSGDIASYDEVLQEFERVLKA